MNILISIMTVIFVIVCLLLIMLILMQSDKASGTGLMGGSSQSTFGSSTADVVTKITGVLVAIFLLTALGLAALSTHVRSSARQELISSEPVDSSSSNAAE